MLSFGLAAPASTALRRLQRDGHDVNRRQCRSSPLHRQKSEHSAAAPSEPQRRRSPAMSQVGSVMQSTHSNCEREDALSAWSKRLSGSKRSHNVTNPIREFVQTPRRPPPAAKKLIKLSNGDPTTYGNLHVGNGVSTFLAHSIENHGSDGYSLSMGSNDARDAVASFASSFRSKAAGAASWRSPQYKASDVMLCAGASGAIEAVLSALADDGDNVLVPSPGFPLFRTAAGALGVETRKYALSAQNNWELLLDDVESLVDERTRAIIVNNPSNPCGSVFSHEHCRKIAGLAERLQLPIVCDEIYAGMTFAGREFVPMAAVSGNVPVISVGGISKRFVVPGWRLGWALVHDPLDVAASFREGLRRLSTRMLCPSTPIQSAVAYMLGAENSNAEDDFAALMRELESNAQYTVDRLSRIDGLRCYAPQGSMYAMVKLDCSALKVQDDFDFAVQLIEEEAVEVLPGRCFEADGYFRVVFCAPEALLSEAFDRIERFCHARTRP